ncbi:MAG: hypothetical protein EKK41_16880 [Hyphomicrobiales bacterium]|nr:MAG: hypothetical protein EKK41_16880 [Hyphomicrobiales bacterium]
MQIHDKQGRAYAVKSAPIGNGLVVYHVTRDGVPVARAALNTRLGCVQDVVVYSVDDRRQGICTALYNAIEAELGIKLVPNRMRLADGKAFWQARTGQDRRALGKFAPRFAQRDL